MNIENFDFNLCLLKILPDQLLSKFHPFLRFHCGSGLGESEYDFLSGPRQMLWHLCPTSGLLKREDMKLSDIFIKTCMQLDFWVSELIFGQTMCSLARYFIALQRSDQQQYQFTVKPGQAHRQRFQTDSHYFSTMILKPMQLMGSCIKK